MTRENLPKYIKDALYWNGIVGAWLRICDLNLVTKKDDVYYTPAHQASRAVFIIREAFPYEEWMEEYIGTKHNLIADKRFKKCTN